MHPQALNYVTDKTTNLEPGAMVLELGSRDLNGGVRSLFESAGPYVGADVTAGAGVDVVFDPSVGLHLGALFDVVVCCEVLEHVADWPSVLRTAAEHLRAGGRLILTAAGEGRRPHSGITGRRELEPGEHYANVSAVDLERELITAGFVDVDVDYVPHDVRAVAVRRARTLVEVPFLDRLDLLEPIVDRVLGEPIVDLLVLDNNGSTDPATLAYLEVLRGLDRVVVATGVPLPEVSLYRLWNDAVERARDLDPGSPVNVAFLNNDVAFGPGTLGVLADELRAAPPGIAAVYPDWRRPLVDGAGLPFTLEATRGAWSLGGLSGFAFMAKAELIGTAFPAFDERYEWIYGDGDFVEGLELAGYTAARVTGLPLDHDKSTSARVADWTRGAKRRDTERRRAKVAERAAV